MPDLDRVKAHCRQPMFKSTILLKSLDVVIVSCEHCFLKMQYCCRNCTLHLKVYLIENKHNCCLSLSRLSFIDKNIYRHRFEWKKFLLVSDIDT